MRYVGIAVFAALVTVTLSSAGAIDPGPRQVLIQARVAEVSGDFRTALGVDFAGMDGTYRSTSNEPFGSGDSTNINGLGGIGGTLWFNTGVLPPAPGNPNALNLGFGVDASGYFGGDDDILRLVRHNNNDIIDTILSRRIDFTIDVLARASIPLIIGSPRILSTDGGEAVVFLEPFIGASVIGSKTELMSDRTGIGGPNLTGSQTDTDIGIVTGVGLTTEVGKIPFLGDIPVLAGLFYKARRVPGSSASVTAGGVTETGSTDSFWQHEALIVLVTPFIIKDDRQ